MTFLIIILITISLISSISFLGANYVNTQPYEDIAFKSDLLSVIHTYELAITAHEKTYNYFPATGNLENDLRKMNIMFPNFKKGDFKYLNENNKVAICYEMNATQDELNVINEIGSNGGFIISSSCFSSTNEEIETISTSSPLTITKWIKGL